MRRLGCLFAFALVSACSMTTPPTTPEPRQSVPNPQPGRFASAGPLPTPSGGPATVSDARLDAIRADLDGRGVPTDSLRIVSAESLAFNDGSLGCPRPGVHYTQALVHGMRIVVEADGRRYDYRFGGSDVARLCERSGPRAIGS
ncbi:MAG: hypothetical protein QM619_07185 [Micropruina sp.]|uniref:hypothetical protein n=1 Tax=Micropruina sp. TaxID=2737536 RepID=UPI0039E2196B